MSKPVEVTLVLPAVARFARLARLTASSLATDAGFDIDDLDDLRVAVNELFAVMVDGVEDPADRVEITYRQDDDCVAVEGRRRLGTGAAPGVLDDLAREILDVIVDEHDIDVTTGDRSFRLLKRARATA